jgi:hypothetical protein
MKRFMLIHRQQVNVIRFSNNINEDTHIGGETQIDQDVSGWIISNIDLLQLAWANVDWICLAQDRNRWRALGNSVLNLRVP